MEENQNIAKMYMPKVLHRFRGLTGMSQQQLADAVGVSKGFISALEGGRSVPNLDMLVRLAEALETRPEKLVEAMYEDYLIDMSNNSSV